MAGPLALVALVVIGLVLEATWLFAGTLSAWVTDVPSFTALQAPAQQVPWQWLHGYVEAWLGPDRTAVLAAPPLPTAQVAFLWSLAVVGLAYALMIAILQRARVRNAMTWGVVGFAVLFVVTAGWMPGFLSGDAILYATFGRLAGVHGIDPYLVPSAWPLANPVDWTWWWFQPTPYGPAWTDLSALVARLTAQLSPIQQVLAFKVLAGVAFVADLGLIWWVLPRLRPTPCSSRDRLLGVALFGWNPLVVFETGQGHNDVLIGTLLLAALVPLVALPRRGESLALRPSRARWLVTVGLLTLGTLVKYLPVIVGLFLTVLRLRQLPSRSARLRTLAAFAGVACGLTALAALPWRDSPAVLTTIVSATAGGQRYANSIIDLPSFTLVARYLDKLSEHIPQSLALVRFWEQLVVRATLAGYVVWEIRRLWRVAPDTRHTALEMTLGASLRATLLVVIFGLTQTLDYYFISPLALAAVLGWRHTWTRVLVAISVLFLPTFYMRRMDLEPVPNLFLLVSLLGPLLGGLLARLRWQQVRQRLADERG